MLPSMDRRVWIKTGESREEIAIGSPLPGVRLLSARSSERHWSEYHSEFGICLVHPGQPGVAAELRCRSRDHVARSAELMLFEPNDVHVTTAVSKSANFSL